MKEEETHYSKLTQCKKEYFHSNYEKEFYENRIYKKAFNFLKDLKKSKNLLNYLGMYTRSKDDLNSYCI